MPTIARMRRMEFAEGAPFGEAEDFTHARVAFIGADAKKKLFSGQNAIGESIRVDGISYQIVGILKHVINNSDDNLNEHIYVPFSAMSDLKDTYYLNSIVMEYEGDNAKVVKALRNSMAFHHSFDPKDERAVFRIRRVLRPARPACDHHGHQDSARLHRPAHAGHRRRRA